MSCIPEVRSRMVKDPYSGFPRRTEERTLWCKTHNVKIGGQVRSANPTGHRYAQKMVEEAWQEHIRSEPQ